MDGILRENSHTTSSSSVAIPNSQPPPPFLSKTYDMVDDPSSDSVVSWTRAGNSFVVWKEPDFVRDLLPKYFKHNNFSSFVRQLNTYGFRKVDPDRQEFANERFLRGQKHLLKGITRRKPAHLQSQPQLPPVQSTSVGSCVEVGKLEIEQDVESLKRDKNVLMQELVRLRQQQQTTDHQLQTVGQRVHLMEQRQQQMMSFLAKAMQSPGFLTQLVHQQSESNMRISGVSKKRRFPRQEEEILVSKPGNVSPSGQIVKYQYLMNEAAEAMLRQILKMNASGRLEPTISNANSFLIDNVLSPSKALDRSSSSSQISGVTLSEVLPTSSQLFEESMLPVNYSSALSSGIQSSPLLASSNAKEIPSPEMNGLNFQEDTGLHDFCQRQDSIPETAVEVPEMSLKDSITEDVGRMGMISGFGDGVIPVEPDGFCDPDDDILLDDPKLPGINDVFWEQFLSASPLTGDTDDVNSSTAEVVDKEQELQTGLESGWDKSRHMNHLTEQMELLASGSNKE